jgi:hypothetical protein
MLKERRFNMNRKPGDKMTANEAKLINAVVTKITSITEEEIENHSMNILDYILYLGTRIHNESEVK